MPFRLRRGREENIGKIREEVVNLIDNSTETTYKIVFYAQAEVQEIMNRVLKRWEESGCSGRPIDYATPEEVKTLYKIAKKIVSKHPSELVAEHPELFTAY